MATLQLVLKNVNTKFLYAVATNGLKLPGVSLLLIFLRRKYSD